MDVPWFSDEQIRVHMLTLDQLSGKADIRVVRDTAGHASENTTAAYFRNLPTARRLSSINLEFQRRIDSTIKFQIAKERNTFSDKFDPQYVDEGLMFPIGDGTSCASPFDPPDRAWIEDGFCNGKNCHKGQGCPNNKIVINKSRVIEVWATAKYYASNWKALLQKNEEGFLTMHGPAMIFNLILKDYIRSSSQWDLVKKIVEDYDE
ncbi:hypothetical protein CI15_07595 [Paraburkholderia monticola]|uniref:Uncharacterized protein n=2 Tax=Paraburkholderia monticola TaxID=1399968 RepID=A0A149PY91_9BURK|nr:hypothetical protein CI15_07595 [Paraburkholderia monticola]